MRNTAGLVPAISLGGAALLNWPRFPFAQE
jgi:hypothetical protein